MNASPADYFQVKCTNQQISSTFYVFNLCSNFRRLGLMFGQGFCQQDGDQEYRTYSYIGRIFFTKIFFKNWECDLSTVLDISVKLALTFQ